MPLTDRPRVLLDVDGVLGDFCTPTFDHLRKIGGPSLQSEGVVQWDLTKLIPTEFHEQCRNLWMSEGFCASIPTYPGTVEGVARLREVADVYFVTAPFYGARHWMWERLCWLKDRHNASDYEVVFVHDKRLVQGDFFVEDRPKNILNWATAHPQSTVVIWDQPYTRSMQEPTNSLRTRSWDDVVGLVEARTG